MSTEDVAQLLAAANGGGDAWLRRTIESVGPANTVAVLTREVGYRARLGELAPRLATPVSIVLGFAHHDELLCATIRVGPDGVTVFGGRRPDPDETLITQDLVEAVRAVYGPRESISTESQVVHWPAATVPAAERPGLPPSYYPVVQRLLRSLRRGEPSDLAELAAACGTDKWSALHRYPEHYDRHFGPLRERRLTVLEIGVGGFGDAELGAESLRMWKHYFPRAILYGLDIEDKGRFDEDRIITVRGDQSDPVALASLADDIGPFDIVIDDGSHVSADVLMSFRTLFDRVRPNGLYVIEDLQTSYWKPMFGGDDADLTDPRYTVGFLKTLIDGLHHAEFLRADARESQPTDCEIRGLHFYHNICFIEKGANVDRSPFAEALRRRA